MRHTVSHVLPAVLAAATLAGLGLLVHYQAGLTGADQAVSEGLIALRNAPLDWLVVLVTLFGDATALTLVAVAIVVALAWRKAWWPAGISAVSFSITFLLVKGIKLAVARERPMADLYGGVESFSFPSGHMTNSMVIYGALAIFAAHALTGTWKRIAVGGLVLLIVLIGFSRVYLGAHWPTDVIAAALLASIMLFLIAWGFDQMLGEGRFARSFTGVLIATLAIWSVYGIFTIEAAFNMYAVDVTPEGRIELEPVQ